EAERDRVLADRRVAADHDAFAEPHVLMHRAAAADEGVVADLAMAAEHRVVGERDIVADMAIVPDMRACHEEAVVADRGDPAAARGAEIDRDALADLALLADGQLRRLAVIVHRLRRTAERGERMDDRPGTDRGAAGKVHMSDQLAAVGDRDMRPDHAVRADADIGPDDRARRDAGGRIDREHHAIPAPAWRRLPPRRRARPRPSPRRDTTTSSCAWPSWSCGIRPRRRARPVCGISPCRW